MTEQDMFSLWPILSCCFDVMLDNFTPHAVQMTTIQKGLKCVGISFQLASKWKLLCLEKETGHDIDYDTINLIQAWDCAIEHTVSFF